MQVSDPDFRVLFESVPGLYLVLTPDLRIVAVSNAYLRATMTKREAILGLGIFEVFPDNPDDPGASGVINLRASLERVINSRCADAMTVQKYDIRRPDSEGGGFEERYWSPVNSPVFGPNGELTYIVHRVEDVTEFIRLKIARTGAEPAAERTEAEIFLRAQQLDEANRRLRQLNEELARLHEQVAGIVGAAAKELGVDLGAQVSSGDMLESTSRMIAAHKRLEEQLRHSQKMEAVGRLAGGIAHDFNNLLTVIVGYARLVHDRLATADPLREKVEEIQRAGELAALLTGQLLAFSRKQATELRTLDLNEVIGGMKDLLRRLLGEDLNLAMFLEPSPCLIRADEGQLTQVLMNLAVNARDAMPAGGKLTVETHAVNRDSEDAGRLGSRPAGRYAMLVVSDNGCGMDSHTLAYMFEPFFTTKGEGKGTGLGLSIVGGIVQQHGGWIDVYSEPGQGTSFRVYFPRAAAAQSTPAIEKTAVPAHVTGTLLLVEDQAPVRMLGEDILSEAGHNVLSAGNGAEALRVSESFAGDIDLLITDVVMPEMSGPELAMRLGRSRPAMGVLYVSGYTDHALLHRGVIEVGTAFLAKPFPPEALVHRVGELLAARSLAKAASEAAG